MGALDKLADKMYGKKRLEVTASLASVATDTYIGTAVSDSEDGNVQVIVSDDVTQPDHWQEFVTYGNLSPFLSHDLTDYGDESSDAYWNNAQAVVAALGSATQTEDGWAHFAGTASDMALAINAAQLEVEDGQEYTLLVELRNIVQAPNGSSAIELSDSASTQIRGDGTEYQYADGIIRLVGKGNASATSGLHLALCSGNSASYDFDMRLSLYTGAYEGGYFPYGEQEITQADLGTAINIPSTVAVKAGDKVLVTASGAEVITPMVVTGVVGRGDEQAAEVEDAIGKANHALTVAEATGQHFWPDDDGIHVTEVTEDEWKDKEGPHFHSGMNVLINSLGQLFRNGLNNLLAIVAGSDPSVLFYDGQGNADANIIAKIQASAAEFARQFNWAVPSAGDVEFFGGLAGVHVESEPFTPEGETAPTVVDLTTSVDGQLDLLSDGYGRAGGALRVQQEVAKQGAGAFGQSITTIEAAASNGTRSGFASLGVQASSSGSSAAKVAANTVWFQGSDGINITVQSMTEVANEFRTATKTLTLTNLGGSPQLTLTRRGHWVLAQMNNVVNPSSANTNISCGTVPSGYRPNKDAFYSGTGAISTTLGGSFRWRVTTAGAITFICSATGNRECQLLAYWYTDDAWPTS